MLKIRLQRVGKRKKPAYRFVVSESTKDLYGKQLEILGHYNPSTKVCDIKKDRVLYWIGFGAQLSPTVHNMFIDQNVIKAEKVRASKSKKKGESETAAPVAAPASPDANQGGKPAEATVTAEAPVAEEKKEETPAQ